jgi:hypothetical protein
MFTMGYEYYTDIPTIVQNGIKILTVQWSKPLEVLPSDHKFWKLNYSMVTIVNNILLYT